MTIKHTLFIAAFAIATTAQAQDSPFPNSTWKIENSQDGALVVLRKAKKLNLPAEQAKFHFIQFDNDRRFETGNDCYGMSGNYDEQAEQQITFKEGVAGMAGDCVEPKSLVGTYAYEVMGDKIELRLIANATDINVEETYDNEDVVDASDEAVEAVKQAAKEAEEAEEAEARSKRKGKR